MPRKTANRPYGLLAKYYDQLFAFHLSWYAAARQGVLGGIMLNLESACDLACGTGTTALDLARKGIKMYGVDLSPTMCRLAREKSRRLGLPFRVVGGDMRHFRLPEPVDLIGGLARLIIPDNTKTGVSRACRLDAYPARDGSSVGSPFSANKCRTRRGALFRQSATDRRRSRRYTETTA